MYSSLKGRRYLVTGIADQASLALFVADELRRMGSDLVCTGLGPTPHHADVSEKGRFYLESTYTSFCTTVAGVLGADVPTFPLDATIDATIDDFARGLAERRLSLDGIVHSIAMDKTIRGGEVKPLLDVTREEFLSCMDVSAYSLVALLRSLLAHEVLQRGSSVVSLSYLGAERVVSHPYKNVGVAKAALERITVELAMELGKSHAIRVNAVRFSPYAESRAGGAIQGLREAVANCQERGPMGNARPEDLAFEVAHLLRPNSRITGEIRHVDGGYHVVG
ncbi:MAG: enoyl-ACP reductase [Alphaproteobacteria bacterium]